MLPTGTPSEYALYAAIASPVAKNARKAILLVLVEVVVLNLAGTRHCSGHCGTHPGADPPKLLNFAISYAREKGAVIFLVFIREVSLTFRERGVSVGTEAMTLGTDREAQEIFSRAQKLCDENNVLMVPLYAVHDSPAEIILDHAATLGVDAVLMGVSQRGAFWKTLKGDVLKEVINYLPPSIPLLIHA